MPKPRPLDNKLVRRACVSIAVSLQSRAETGAMAPKKRQRTSVGGKATLAATSVEQLTPLHRRCDALMDIWKSF